MGKNPPGAVSVTAASVPPPPCTTAYAEVAATIRPVISNDPAVRGVDDAAAPPRTTSWVSESEENWKRGGPTGRSSTANATLQSENVRDQGSPVAATTVSAPKAEDRVRARSSVVPPKWSVR